MAVVPRSRTNGGEPLIDRSLAHPAHPEPKEELLAFLGEEEG